MRAERPPPLKIAIRDYRFPASKTTALTPDLHNRVASKLQALWGPRAGWAQQVLFFADLKTPSSPSPKKAAARETPSKPVKAKWEEELEQLVKVPGQRRRVQIVKVEYRESEGEESSDASESPTKRGAAKKQKVEE